MTATRLSLIEDHEARSAQAERNNELSANNQPIEGEELWTEKDYRLQMEYCIGRVEKAEEEASILQDRMALRGNVWNEPEGLPGDSG